MLDKLIAKRYALGLFKAARESNAISRVKDDGLAFCEAMRSRRAFFVWLSCVEVPASKRIERCVSILKGAKCDQLLINFISLLIDRGRIGYYEEITSEFGALCDVEDGIMRGEITAVGKKMAEEVRSDVEAILSKKLKKRAVMSIKEDPSLIGGIRIRINDTVCDMSMIRKIEDMRAKLCQ